MKTGRGHGVGALLTLVSVAIFLEALFYAALSPLLPDLKREIGMSTSEAGVLVAMYPLGIMLSAIPVAILSVRIGVKQIATAGMVMLSAMLVAFAVADSYATLLASRLLQGLASGAIWGGTLVWLYQAGPPERRGELIGVVLGAMAAGQIAGPVVGGVAASVGRAPTFTATAALGALLAVAMLRFAAPARPERRLVGVREALGSGAVRLGMLLVGLPWIALGAIHLLAPLQLDRLGAGAGGIATTFVIAAAASVVVQPLVGRWSDRRGRLRPIRLGLLASVATLSVLALVENRWLAAALVVLALIFADTFWGPSMALLSDACDSVGVGQIVGFAIVQFAGTPGNIAGSAGGGAIAQSAGEEWAYFALAAVLAVVFLLLIRQREARPALQAPPQVAGVP